MAEPSAPQSPRKSGILAAVPRRPVAVTMLFLATAVFGLVSLGRLPMDLLPEISYPTLTVRTAYPGAAPEDVEERISERVQEALSTLSGLVRSSSISRAETSDVLLEFAWGTNMTFAVQEVRDRLDGVFLPNDAERPLILRYDPNLDPILRVGVRAPESSTDPKSEETLIRLRWLAEQRIKRQLETIQGVAAVQVHGGLEEEILIQVDPARLAALGLTPQAIGTRLAQENLNASAGQIREGSTDYLVRTLNEFQSVEEIGELALERRADSTIRIQDVAQITRTYAEREVITRIKGSEAVEVSIYREAGANIVDVATQVREKIFGTEKQQGMARGGGGGGWWAQRELTQLAHTLRKEARFDLLSDQSVFIKAAVDDVRQAGALGALFAVLVMWLFLRRVAATMIIALAIPISVIATFAPMLLSGVSLNIMSLGGLALGIGMLVDNAIVVLESITRCREENDELQQAAVRGTSEVAGAITASTLTTVAIFAPIVFVEGIAGQIFADQAVTVVSSLLVSLAVALLFIPMLAARPMLATGGWVQDSFAWVGASGAALKANPLQAPWRGLQFSLGFARREILGGLRWSWARALDNVLSIVMGIVRLLLFLALRVLLLLALLPAALIAVLGWVRRLTFDPAWSALEYLYPRTLRLALAAPWIVVALVALLGWGAYERAKGLGIELLPEIHQGEFTAFMTLEVGTPIELSQAIFGEIDRSVRNLPAVETTALTVGVEAETLTREIEGENTGRLTVRMKALASGSLSNEESEARLEEQVRRIIEDHPAVAKPPTFRRPTPFSLESPIAVEIRGHNLDVLAEMAEEVEGRLSALPSLTDVRSTLHPGHPEALLTFQRDKALTYGLDIGAMSNFVRDQVLGRVDTRFVEGEDRIAIRVRADPTLLRTLEDVRSLIVNPEAENPIPLGAVAELSQVQGPAEIRRIGNNRAVLVTANSTGLDLGGVTTAIESALADLSVPDNVSIELGGQKRELDQSSRSLTLALLLAIFLVYVVMATQFESLLQPFIILISVPLAGIGVVYVLSGMQVPLSVVVFVGLILLAGIVVNNAIVLVDRINQRRGEGVELHAAILDAGKARLRPILMTTMTTVLGLLPLTGWLKVVPLLASFGAGEGAELRAPMAITVITGLISSTLLTLIVVPVLYSLLVRRPVPPRSV